MEWRRLIEEFIGASIGNFPLMGLLTWGFFLLLKPLGVTRFKTSGLSRESRVWTSCITVGIGLLLLTVGGGDPLTTHNLFQEIAVGFWLIVGLLYWGKSKSVPPTSKP